MLTNALVEILWKRVGTDEAGAPVYEKTPGLAIRGTLHKVGVLFQDSASTTQQAHPNVGRLMVMDDELTDPEMIVAGDKIHVVPDGRHGRTYVVSYAWDRVGKAGLSGYLEFELRDPDQEPVGPGK